ncbi:MAG TPA: tetratricopeptide repeat protein [Candidatus Paceibacterota bacterium]|nr:tetratricopeptide repeat protein [Candidatus Paceibacterota bacterium]
MNTSTRNILIGVGIVVVLALIAYFGLEERQNTPSGPLGSTATTSIATSTRTATSSTITVNASSTGGIQISGSGYTIKPITAPVAPNFKTPLTLSASMDTSTQAQYQSQFAAVQSALTANRTNFEAWLELAGLRKGTGDYKGAAADWTYLTEIYPTDPTAFADLGDLYANYLHQPAQAIADYKQAIKLDPTKEETFYDNLAQVYLAEGDKTDAKAILQKGISVEVVGYQNLQDELNSIQ